MAALDDPAAAVAASLCLASRTRDDRRTARHPGRCGWCDYPAGELRRMVEGFNAWAGLDQRRGAYARLEARWFSEMPRAEQQRRVLEAQGLESAGDQEDLPWL